jgi:hypothetical protein
MAVPDIGSNAYSDGVVIGEITDVIIGKNGGARVVVTFWNGFVINRSRIPTLVFGHDHANPGDPSLVFMPATKRQSSEIVEFYGVSTEGDYEHGDYIGYGQVESRSDLPNSEAE